MAYWLQLKKIPSHKHFRPFNINRSFAKLLVEKFPELKSSTPLEQLKKDEPIQLTFEGPNYKGLINFFSDSLIIELPFGQNPERLFEKIYEYVNFIADFKVFRKIKSKETYMAEYIEEHSAEKVMDTIQNLNKQQNFRSQNEE